MKFFIVDAFTSQIFGGNPAGVVIIPEGEDYPNDFTMLKTAAELRYSETAFVKILGDNKFNVRYFTPEAEVALCGHATIGSFFCLAKAGLLDPSKPCINHTIAQTLEIDIDGDFVMMDMADPVTLGHITETKELQHMYQIMGSSYMPDKLPFLPQIISTGLPDLMVPVASKAELDNLTPDMPAISKISAKYDVTGIHAFYLNPDRETDHITAYCRNFAPLYGIPEEAATGTSNGALTYCLFLNNIIEKKSSCRIIQGESMGRPSKIITKLNSGRIKVGGSAVILAEGEINL